MRVLGRMTKAIFGEKNDLSSKIEIQGQDSIEQHFLKPNDSSSLWCWPILCCCCRTGTVCQFHRNVFLPNRKHTFRYINLQLGFTHFVGKHCTGWPFHLFKPPVDFKFKSSALAWPGQGRNRPKRNLCFKVNRRFWTSGTVPCTCSPLFTSALRAKGFKVSQIYHAIQILCCLDTLPTRCKVQTMT